MEMENRRRVRKRNEMWLGIRKEGLALLVRFSLLLVGALLYAECTQKDAHMTPTPHQEFAEDMLMVAAVVGELIAGGAFSSLVLQYIHRWVLTHTSPEYTDKTNLIARPKSNMKIASTIVILALVLVTDAATVNSDPCGAKVILKVDPDSENTFQFDL
ncbi:hypothetical protein GJAV_G00120220, partial [Gymnothorax javanicus]